MSTTTPTSELDAINTMLSCIGEAPINDLTTTVSVSVNTAKNVLNETIRSVLNRGWYFNSEEDFPLVRDSNNELVLPTNTLRVRAAREFWDLDVAQRGNKLYDRKNHTFQFEKDIKVDIVIMLPFEDLPEAARGYITILAARTFQGRMQGSETVYKFTEDDLSRALVAMQDAEADTAKYNIFTGSVTMQRMVNRMI